MKSHNEHHGEIPPIPKSVPLVERFWKGQWEPVKEWPQDAHLVRWVEWCRVNQIQGCQSRTDWGGSTHRCVWSVDGSQPNETGDAWGAASAKTNEMQRMIERAAAHDVKTLRDEFALAAMPIFLNRMIGESGGNPETWPETQEKIAHLSYQIANAMMQERSKESVAVTDMPQYPPIE